MSTATSTTPTPVTITMYTTSTCGRCKVLARRLEKMGLEPNLIVLDQEEDVVKETIMDTFKIEAVPLTIIEGLFDHPVYFTDISPDITIALKKRLDTFGDITNEEVVLNNTTWLPEDVDFRDLTRLTFDDKGVLQY